MAGIASPMFAPAPPPTPFDPAALSRQPLPSALATLGVALRPQHPSDRTFLHGLYCEERAAEVAATGWPAAQRGAFLDSQFALQSAHYDRCADQGSVRMIVTRACPPMGIAPIGRLYLDPRGSCWSLHEIALIAAQRSQGIGRALLGWTHDAARAAGAREIALHVLHANIPAQRLYASLGYRETACDIATHRRMVLTLD